MDKNKQIAETMKNTIERHSNMVCKTFEVKVQDNKLSKLQKESLTILFLEGKWYWNYILGLYKENHENKISKFDTKIKSITKKDKDMNDVPYEIKYLSSQMRQSIVTRMVANIKTINSLTKLGKQKGGELGFQKENTIIDLKQYGNSYKNPFLHRVGAIALLYDRLQFITLYIALTLTKAKKIGILKMLKLAQ